MCANRIPEGLRPLAVAELKHMRDVNDFLLRQKLHDVIDELDEAVKMLDYAKTSLMALPTCPERATYDNPAPQLAETRNICARAIGQVKVCMEKMDDTNTFLRAQRKRFVDFCDRVKREFHASPKVTTDLIRSIDVELEDDEQDALARFAALKLRLRQ
jgi:hypothetical protein